MKNFFNEEDAYIALSELRKEESMVETETCSIYDEQGWLL